MQLRLSRDKVWMISKHASRTSRSHLFHTTNRMIIKSLYLHDMTHLIIKRVSVTHLDREVLRSHGRRPVAAHVMDDTCGKTETNVLSGVGFVVKYILFELFKQKTCCKTSGLWDMLFHSLTLVWKTVQYRIPYPSMKKKL